MRRITTAVTVALAVLALAGAALASGGSGGGGGNDPTEPPGAVGGGGGGGGGSTAAPVLCGTVAAGLAGVVGYYGIGGFHFALSAANCGNVGERFLVHMVEVGLDPACEMTVPDSASSRTISPGSTQTWTVATSAVPYCYPMALTRTFTMTLEANGVVVDTESVSATM